MELKAENAFTIDEEMYRECMGALIQNEYMPAAKKMLVALGVIWVILAVITFKFGGGIVGVLVELAVMVFAGVWMMAVTPKKRISKAWEMTKRAGDGLDRHASFYEDRMEVEPGSLIVNYEDVQKTLETEHMMVLISEEGVGVMLSKAGFTKGDPSVVKALLEEWKR